jgi:archaemetzincin
MWMKVLIVITLLSLLSCSRDKTIKVGIQPFGNFEGSLADTISNVLRKTFRAKVYILQNKALPDEAFINVKSPRYRADKIIGMMKARKPDSLNYIVSLIDKDISTTKRDELGGIKKPESKYSDWGILAWPIDRDQHVLYLPIG